MNIENQVCSLELSKRLKEFCIKQESIFYYIDHFDDYKIIPVITDYDSEIFNVLTNDIFPPKLSSAFTAAELGELLPNRITISDDNIPFESFTIIIKKFYTVNEDRTTTNNYILNYECDSTEAAGENAWLRRYLMNNIFDPNLANAMARMLIYLIENGLMK